jgi:hypothetical protein
MERYNGMPAARSFSMENPFEEERRPRHRGGLRGGIAERRLVTSRTNSRYHRLKTNRLIERRWFSKAV